MRQARVFQSLRTFVSISEFELNLPDNISNYFIPIQVVRCLDRKLAVWLADVTSALLALAFLAVSNVYPPQYEWERCFLYTNVAT